MASVLPAARFAYNPPHMIPLTRIVHLVESPPVPRGRYVLYWMQQSQRTRFNHALEYAIAQADRLKRPVVACFGLMDDYPEANARHYVFMLQGLRDVARNLASRGINLVIGRGQPAEVAQRYAREAALVVCDRGYLRHQRQWRRELAAACARDNRPLVQVESDAVVPVEVASNKREFAARTIRPRIHRHLAEHLAPLPTRQPAKSSLRLDLQGDIDPAEPEAALAKLKVDHSTAPVPRFFIGGEDEAHRRLAAFVAERLKGYDQGRNEPALGHTSHLSPYLHFGQISALEIALAVRDARSAPQEDRDAFIEELIVRRELAMNYCQFAEDYDSYDALPAWAKQTLKDRAADRRADIYSREELAAAHTHDEYWNAAQTEMNVTGFMHNYMRMYWGKKILEWTPEPRQAFETMLALNNRLFLDGRDPTSYASVAWIFGLHDRPWGPARPIFGTVRYMNAAGLNRKFDMDAYVRWVQGLQP